jgi:acetyltransferase
LLIHFDADAAEPAAALHPRGRSARKVVERALADGHRWLDPLEVAKVFGTYVIPVTRVSLAREPETAAAASEPFFAAGGAGAVKIFSRDIVHKSDVGGVQLNLANAQAVREAAADIMAKARD